MDGVKALTGREINVSDVEYVLENMGTELTEKEWLKLLKNLPIDADGKIYQNRLMDGMASLRGGTVDVHKLDTVLGNMGISLTEKELKDLTQNLPVNADGKIVLNKLMDGVKAIIGEDIGICDTEDILENMGIEFTDEELLELLKKLPVDADGKIHQNRLLEGIKTLRGGGIDVSKLDTVLGSMGMNLTEKELEDLTQSLPVDVDGKVDRKKVMEDVKAFTGEKIDINNLENVLSNKGTELPDTEYTELVKTLPVSGDGKVHKNRILKGVKSFKRGKVDSSNLKSILEKMDIKLTEKEFEELKENLLMVCIVDTLVSPQRKFCPSLTAENF
ncbi:uncharacterized protein LOC130839942 isoform X3 [Hippopotamus amphibius kiboko]|nr:uncharacterized protein LOC130839942 isoform X3 [Hippopotamus amphibius kiboko]XP_057570751.1 uncharacterized protein LOC130839942 isoform X3 [Hippopotamus amphibius kiboko]XP_057570752.1 uncharacterized protein LOC130839942 isoform X3 [Hippopotamus amphibius kiboko]